LANVPLPKEGTICALPIPGFGVHRVGRDHSGAVCLVIAAPEFDGPVRPDVRLKNLSVQRRVSCDILRPNGEQESIIGTVVACSADSNDLRGFFLDLFEQALHAVAPEPSGRDLDSWIDHATRLFADLDAASALEMRGLWGELLVVCEARDPATLIRRWHESPEDRHDFVCGSFALEVKTCRDSERVHHFSLLQIRPVADMEVIVASVPVYTDPHGMSAVDLLTELETRISAAPIRDRLRQIVFRLGGTALAQTVQRFDRRAAVDGLKLMRASRIPAVEERPPSEVLDVQLTVRCRDVPSEDLAEVVESRFVT
jgi:hypothetical protein